ncbi:MAG: ATP-binding protein [Paracoccaceae bacterium]
MLREDEDAERSIAKLVRINQALMQRLERIEETRGSSYALTRAAAILEREVVARNNDLEAALSDLAKINAELARAREIADEANRAKSRFLRAASHDLLQPLSAAKLFLSHLTELSERSSDTMQSALVSHLTATFESAEELIRALSDIARFDSQNFRMNPAPLAISRLFRRLIIDMQPLATSRGIDLRFVSSSVTVESDPVYLRQIAQNLIGNALKYTTRKKVLVGIRHDADAVWLEVLDAGPGIAGKDQERIFMEFERLSRQDQPGAGLGLSIVRRACQQLGHALELRSELGKGSRFRVRLARTDAQPLGPAKAANQRTAPVDFNGRRVLVVENDPVMRQAYGFLLGGWGMQVQSVDSVGAAREAIARVVPDLLLTDYRLDGDETGLQTINALTEDLGRALPALIVSAESAQAIRAEAGNVAVAILEKPVAEADLRSALQAALTQR